MKSGEDIENVGHKLGIRQPWLSHNLSIDDLVSFRDIPVSDSSVLTKSVHVAIQSIPDTSHIYDDIYQNTGTNKKTEESAYSMYQGKADCALEWLWIRLVSGLFSKKVTLNVFVNNTKLYMKLSGNIFVLQYIFHIYDIYLLLSIFSCYYLCSFRTTED